eukprot:CAMPEP_0201529392 /NCGR_PEP_ID=MMETSP0161_2-20130828/41542_1 /ASSEMBLY_ACC=CAM_ASM_000251 /TAXON_ID=180227 /ORGANISM="Neoparamoeba aestuarina, Strain SoJaBio B1-5/56/2" /LENGTH=64 /DNA_ID=CAMNT_0047931169 /DNA_START=32 /DNA_END=226 /DNA_ORIENTATION=-
MNSLHRLSKIETKDIPFDVNAEREVCLLHKLKRKKSDMVCDAKSQWVCKPDSVCPWSIEELDIS